MALRVKSVTINGEGVVCGPDGVTDFNRLGAAMGRKGSPQAFLYAFDLLELDSPDLRREPWETRRATLVSLLRKVGEGVRLSAALALKHRLPTIFPNGDLARSGGLMTYGASLPTTFYTMGEYAAKIISGAKPSDLPIAQPTSYKTVINLKAAKALGIIVPEVLLARADEVIE